MVSDEDEAGRSDNFVHSFIHSFVHFISQNTSYKQKTGKINVLEVFRRTDRQKGQWQLGYIFSFLPRDAL